MGHARSMLDSGSEGHLNYVWGVWFYVIMWLSALVQKPKKKKKILETKLKTHLTFERQFSDSLVLTVAWLLVPTLNADMRISKLRKENTNYYLGPESVENDSLMPSGNKGSGGL